MLERLSKKFTEIIRQIQGRATISGKNIQAAIEEIKMALLEADVNLRVVRRFVNYTVEEALGAKVVRDVTPSQQFIKIVSDKIVQLLGEKREDLKLKGPDTQSSILFLGLQGSGKTTTAAKIALHLKKQNRKPLLVAADLKRPAAVEQLLILGKQIDIDVYKENHKDPLKVVKNALNYAKKQQFDTVLLDTSGRLQIDEEMMIEIEKIKKITDPEETILVADAMTGQNAVDIAKEFDDRIGLSGIILSKFDSDTRGGAALSIKSVTGKTIKFIGVGEKLEDIEPFYPERIASRILGMGDIVTLVEKVQQTIELEDALALQKKITSKKVNLEDYLEQFRRIKQMGSIHSLLEMIPGIKGKINEEEINLNEFKQEEAIILAMTPYERQNPRIIGPRRKKRIAKGSGTAVFDVNKLLKKFEKSKIMMKKMARNKAYQSHLMSHI